MEESKWLKLMTIGLVLAAIAVGYFLFNGRFSSNNGEQQSQADKAVSTASPSPSSGETPNTSDSSTPIPGSAFSRIISRNQINQANQQDGRASTLPRTGFPIELVAAFSISALISGWGLRRFPR